MIINKFAGMFYEIKGNNIVLEVTESFEERPDVHISKSFYTNNSEFWNFVFDAVVEAKLDCSSAIENEEGDYSPDAINRAIILLEKFHELETTLSKSGLVRDRAKAHEIQTAGDLLTPA